MVAGSSSWTPPSWPGGNAPGSWSPRATRPGRGSRCAPPASTRAAQRRPVPERLVLTEEAALRRPDDVATVLVAARYPPTSLTVTHDDLESHFLRLVGAGTGGDDG